MKKKKVVDVTGREQEAFQEGEMIIPIGPPLRVVDSLGLPEPFATRLHNTLCQRGLLTYADVKRDSRSLQGALQEVLNLDVQKLSEAYYHYENP